MGPELETKGHEILPSSLEWAAVIGRADSGKDSRPSCARIPICGLWSKWSLKYRV